MEVKLEVKNGDKVKFLEECRYCKKEEILGTSYMKIGGMELDNDIIDITPKIGLNKFWNYIQQNKLSDGDEFVIPKGAIVTIADIYIVTGECTLNIDNHLKISFPTFYLLESKDDNSEGFLTEKLN